MWQISNLEALHSIQQAIFNFQKYASHKKMYKWIRKGAKRNLTELWELSNKTSLCHSPYFLVTCVINIIT